MRTYSKISMLFLVILLFSSMTTTGLVNDSNSPPPIFPQKTVMVTARRLKEASNLNEPVTLKFTVANHKLKNIYIINKAIFLRTSIGIEDSNGTRILPRAHSRPLAPRSSFIKKNGKKIYTVPVVKIEPGKSKELSIPDALKDYHGQLKAGTYYLRPRDIDVITEVTSIFTRNDVPHPLWIDPKSIVKKSKYKIQMPENRIQLESEEK